MSAWLIGPDHLDGLLTLAVKRSPRSSPVTWQGADGELRTLYGATDRTAIRELTEVGRMLAAENARSVGRRYEEEPNNLLEAAYEFRRVQEELSPVDGFSMLACFEYQACEHEGWEGSEARRFCDALRKALISRLPGYADAPWEFTREWAQRRDAERCEAARRKIEERRRASA